MINRQPYSKAQAKGPWQRKLAAGLLGLALACVPLSAARAFITDTVVANGTSVGQPISATATKNVSVVLANPSLTISEVATLNTAIPGNVQPGDTITYKFTITNTGNITLGTVTLTDGPATPSGGPIATLAPTVGDTTTFTATHVLTAVDIAAGNYSNPVSTQATAASGGNFSANTTVTTSLTFNSSMTLVKTGTLNMGGNDRADVGDVITYQFLITNTGPTPLHNITIADPLVYASLTDNSRMIAMLDGARQDSDPISVGATDHVFTGKQCTATTPISADLIPTIDTVQLDESGLNVERQLVRMSGDSPTLAAGDKIGFLYNLNNTGNVPLTGIVVEQADALAFSNRLDLLAPNAADNSSVIFTRNVTADEIKAGQIIAPAMITAHARGRSTTQNLDSVIALSAIRTYDSIATATIPAPTWPLLNPGQSTTFTGTYALVQADIDNGKVHNTATASALNTLNQTLLSSSSFDVIWPAIHLVKTVAFVKDENLNGFTDAGDTVHYAFAITNTGKVALNNILVTDTSLPGVVFNTTTPLASLAPGATDTTTFTSVYTITQANVNAGEVDNIAKVEATDVNNVKVVGYSDPGIPTGGPLGTPTKSMIAPNPVVTLLKVQSSWTDTNNNAIIDAGDVLHYTFTVANAGNLPLTTVNVTDLLPGVVMVGSPIANLNPGQSDNSTFTASYVITNTDMLNGSVSNQAKATGQYIGGTTSGQVSDLSDNSDPTKNNPTVTAIVTKPVIGLVKRIVSIIDTNNNGVTDVGDTINYAFDIKNTGNVTLTDVYVTDPLIATILPVAHIANLPAGNEVKNAFTAAYVLTATDISNGKVTNQATAFGTFNNAPVSHVSDNSVYGGSNQTVATLGAGIGLIKTFATWVDVNGNGIVDANDEFDYSFAVKNIGSGAITNIWITDPLTTNIYGGGVLGAALPSLAAGATNTTFFTAKYIIKNSDLVAGGVTNQATVHGTSSTNTAISDVSDSQSFYGNAPTYTAITQSPGVALLKTFAGYDDLNSDGVIDLGDRIKYAFTVVNTGNTPLVNLVMTDANAVLGAVVGPINLAIGASDATTFKASHIVTPADVAAGQVSNSATVQASLSGGGFVTDMSDPTSLTGNAPTLVAVVNPAIGFTKVANKSQVKRGEEVLYTITASNLAGGPFQITDIMPPGFAFETGTAMVNGVAKTPVINARNLAFPGLNPTAGKITLTLKLLASTTFSTGKFINNAQLINPNTAAVLAMASATVSITEDSLFDCSDIIGRVFDDKNANGYMDDGETGLAGVRLVTLNGLLVTTDAEGRYHVPCAAIPDAAIGSNFLMKLDTRTLPTGYKLTTENPRDVRVTRGKVVKLNFGASQLREVRVDLTGKAFHAGTNDLTDTWAKGIDQLLDVLGKQRSTLKIVYHLGGEDPDLAQARVSSVEETVNFAWKSGNGAYKLVTTSSVEVGK